MTAEDESRDFWASKVSPPEQGVDLTLEMMRRATQQLEELGTLDRAAPQVFQKFIVRVGADGQMEWLPDTFWNRHAPSLRRAFITLLYLALVWFLAWLLMTPMVEVYR
jgi:hypothetical protein